MDKLAIALEENAEAIKEFAIMSDALTSSMLVLGVMIEAEHDEIVQNLNKAERIIKRTFN